MNSLSYEKIDKLNKLFLRNEQIYEDIKDSLQNIEIYVSIFKENMKEIKEEASLRENNGEEEHGITN